MKGFIAMQWPSQDQNSEIIVSVPPLEIMVVIILELWSPKFGCNLSG